MPEPALERARRRGRRIGIVLYIAILSLFIVVCGTQVIYQGFSTVATETTQDCRAGILDLIGALRRARAAAATEPLGERASLERFRTALQPEWEQRGQLSTVCRADNSALESLSAVDRLRYAEEHAVRYESVDLAPNRRRVLAIEQNLSKAQRSGP